MILCKKFRGKNNRSGLDFRKAEVQTGKVAVGNGSYIHKGQHKAQGII